MLRRRVANAAEAVGVVKIARKTGTVRYASNVRLIRIPSPTSYNYVAALHRCRPFPNIA